METTSDYLNERDELSHIPWLHVIAKIWRDPLGVYWRVEGLWKHKKRLLRNGQFAYHDGDAWRLRKYIADDLAQRQAGHTLTPWHIYMDARVGDSPRRMNSDARLPLVVMAVNAEDAVRRIFIGVFCNKGEGTRKKTASYGSIGVFAEPVPQEENHG